MTWIALVARATIGCVFVLSLLGKVTSPTRWRRFVTATRDLVGVGGAFGHPVADPIVRVLAVVTAIGEGFIAVTMPTVAWRAGLVASILLLGSFCAVLARTLMRRTRITCGCFGPSQTVIGWPHIARNTLLIGLAAGGLLLNDPTDTHVRPTAISIGVLLGVAVALLDTFVELLAPTTRPV